MSFNSVNNFGQVNEPLPNSLYQWLRILDENRKLVTNISLVTNLDELSNLHINLYTKFLIID